MTKRNNPDIQTSKYWIGPLLAGLFWAIGHESTKRILITQGNWHEYSTKEFPAKKPTFRKNPDLFTLRFANPRKFAESQKNENSSQITSKAFKNKLTKNPVRKILTESASSNNDIVRGKQSSKINKEIRYLSSIEALNNLIDEPINSFKPKPLSITILIPLTNPIEKMNQDNETLHLKKLNYLFKSLGKP